MKLCHGCCCCGSNTAVVGPSTSGPQEDNSQQDRNNGQIRALSPNWYMPILKPQSRRPTLLEDEEENGNIPPRLSEPNWTLQRARIGLPTRTRLTVSERKQLQEWNFVSSSFCRKECVLYSCNDVESGSTDCCCGASAADHNTCPTFIGTDYTSSLDGQPAVPRAWDESFAIHEFPTNAFGLVTLVQKDGKESPRPIPYLRLADSTDTGPALTLLEDFWGLESPHLLICLASSGREDSWGRYWKLPPAVMESISTGIVRAARSTKAWILTDGSDSEPNSLIAEALAQWRPQATGQLGKTIPCVGIAPWGRLMSHRRQRLINDDITSLNHARLEAWVRWAEPGLRLNASHTHILLVDDGFRLSRSKVESSVGLRWRLASAVSAPRLLLLLAGGTDALREALGLFVGPYTPIVAVKGSGGAADVVVSAQEICQQNYLPGGREHALERLLRESFPLHSWLEGELQNLQEDLQRLCKGGQLTVVDVELEPNLDASLLTAILQSGDVSTRFAQLRLALQWDRPDLAERLFQQGSSAWDSAALHDIFHESLILDRVGFVRLLVAQGVDLHNFLNGTKLRILYQEAAEQPNGPLRKILSNRNRHRPVTLDVVHRLLCRLLVQHSEEVYHVRDSEEDLKFQDPAQELLIWAVLSGRLETADFLQSRCDSPMLGAVVAASLCGALTQILPDRLEVLTEHRRKFQQVATQLADACLEADDELAACLLERPLTAWNQSTLLQLAAKGRLKNFLCAKCCQNAVNQAWKRGFQELPPISILIGLVCPLVVCWTKLVRPLPLGDRGGPPTPAQTLLAFYKAPATKFAAHAVCWLSLLGLLSHVLLGPFWFSTTYQVEEAFMWLWLGALLVDEVREVNSQQENSTWDRLALHLRSQWNQLDCLALLLALLAFLLRHGCYSSSSSTSSCVLWTRGLLAVHVALLHLRIFRVYYAHVLLGPKLVAFYRMIPHMFLFLLLLLVFALAFGVGAQVLLLNQDQKEDSWSWFRMLFLRPYWQMFGELQLEELDGGNAVCAEGQAADCPQEASLAWMAQLMLAVYLLFSNVMLLNLLIAIFTKVFEKVQAQAEQIWRYQMALLLAEFDSRPVLAPPLTPLYLIYRLLLLFWNLLIPNPETDFLDSSFRGHRDTLPPTSQLALKAFEHDCAHTIRTREKSMPSNEIQMERLHKQVEDIARHLHQDKKKEQVLVGGRDADSLLSQKGGEENGESALDSSILESLQMQVQKLQDSFRQLEEDVSRGFAAIQEHLGSKS